VPVVVTGSDTALGAAVVAALPGEVRSVPATSPVLRDGGRLAAALAGAHTLVHLVPHPLDSALDLVLAGDLPARVVTLAPLDDVPPPSFLALERAAHADGFDLIVLRVRASVLGGELDPVVVAAVLAADAVRKPGARVQVLTPR